MNRSAFYILTTLFFMWGFITCMNDLLIPSLKDSFDLSYAQAMLVQMAFFGAYFIVSLLYFILSLVAGDPIAKIGYQRGLVLGLAVSGVGCALFYPAAELHVYGLFLGALFVLASGITIIQIAANPYVSILGPPETASSRLNLAQGLNSLGYVVAPALGGYFIFSTVTSDASSVKAPYLVLALAFFVLATIFFFLRLPQLNAGGRMVKDFDIFKNKRFHLGMVAIYCYVGAEVTVGSLFINYLILPDVLPESIAGATEEARRSYANHYLPFYWGGLMVGRFLGAIALSGITDVMKKYLYMAAAVVGGIAVIFFMNSHNFKTGEQVLNFSDILPYLGLAAFNFAVFVGGSKLPGRMVGGFSVIIMVLIASAMATTGLVALWAIVGVGLFNSVMWSNIFTLSIAGLGERTSQGSSLLVMMIVGGALVPQIQGFLADAIELRYSFIVPLLCYVYLAWYGFTSPENLVKSEK